GRRGWWKEEEMEARERSNRHDHVVQDAEMREEARDLEGAGEPECGPAVDRQAGGVGSKYPDFTGTRRNLPVDGIEERGLSGAVASHDCPSFPSLQLHPFATERAHPAAAVREIVDHERAQTTLLVRRLNHAQRSVSAPCGAYSAMTRYMMPITNSQRSV